MRRFIIDTDTGSDDAVALLMFLLSGQVQVEAVTTVCGNITMEQATQNALMTMEVAGKAMPPVYRGAEKPLMRELVMAQNVHGQDGMGDSDLIHPKSSAAAGHAVDAIIDIVRKNPGEIEILALGPATNLALAMMKEPAVMKQVKHIYSMGTGGFGLGNATPVAEFNVYVDAEAYAVMLNSGIPITIAGFDICLGEAALHREEIELLQAKGSPAGRFAVDCNKTLLAYNIRRSGDHFIDLPDPVAAGVALWEDMVLDARDCYCYTCTREAPAYGQVIVYEPQTVHATQNEWDARPANARVVKTIDTALFKKRLMALLMA